MSLGLIAAALALANPLAGAPDTKSRFSDQTAAELLRQCESAKGESRDKNYQLGLCIGYLIGARTGAELVLAMAEQFPPWCIPQGTSRGDIWEVMMNFVKKTPRAADDSAADVLLEALADAYPCQKAQAK